MRALLAAHMPSDLHVRRFVIIPLVAQMTLRDPFVPFVRAREGHGEEKRRQPPLHGVATGLLRGCGSWRTSWVTRLKNHPRAVYLRKR